MSAVCPKKSVFSRLLFLLFLQDSCCSALELVLLHTNDVHARVEETSVHSGTCGSESSACFAGVARRATEVARIRSTERHVLLLDAGDQFQGTVWFNHYKGAEAAHFMNKLKYDAMAFGNHEFDNGLEGLKKPFMEQILCPIVSANLKTDPSIAATFGKSYLPYKILTVAGEQVGIVGYVSQETSALSKPGPLLLFEAEIPALQLQVDKLRTLGVNKIIALGHSGFTVDKEIARKVRGVDVVIGGHSNTFLYTGTQPSTEFPAGDYPFMVKSDDGRQVPVVQAYAFGKYLGYLKVTFNEAGDLLKATGNPILLDGSVTQDPEFLADVQEWKKSLANFSSQVVGQTQVFLNGSAEECRFRECNLGNMICDAMILQQHPVLRRPAVEPRQRLHLQRRRSPDLHRRENQERIDHHGGPDLRASLRGNLRPGAAEGLHAVQSLRTLNEAIRTKHRGVPAGLRVSGGVRPLGVTLVAPEPQHPLHPVPSPSVRGGGAAGGLQGGAACVPRRGRRRVLHVPKRDSQTRQRGFGYFRVVGLHRSETESLSVC
ncbi:snake venom 5'-nucleotidase-like isoform X1 [Trematomus bernacchii]|uniref:snake venom 5'-nucleotidase-like isoform X1 n=1 Tax=Trematomus bernacchii TaxID=40690 RepID=UPI00146E2F26|nr:snake venom 5'-nucleotidase-like isoform X1 [Trematomus bernacchii]